MTKFCHFGARPAGLKAAKLFFLPKIGIFIDFAQYNELIASGLLIVGQRAAELLTMEKK